MTVEKPKPKQLLRPVTTRTNSAMNQSQFLAITCNLLEAREKSRVHGAIGFGFASHWLKNWRESFKPTTKCSNRNHVITFDSHLKTALTTASIWCCTSFCCFEVSVIDRCLGALSISQNWLAWSAKLILLWKTHHAGTCLSKVPKRFGPIYVFATRRFKTIKLCNPLGSSYIEKHVKGSAFRKKSISLSGPTFLGTFEKQAQGLISAESVILMSIITIMVMVILYLTRVTLITNDSVVCIM